MLLARTVVHSVVASALSRDRVAGPSRRVSTAATPAGPAANAVAPTPAGAAGVSSPLMMSSTASSSAPDRVIEQSSRWASSTAYGLWPSTHCGSANSASVSCSARTAPSVRR